LSYVSTNEHMPVAVFEKQAIFQ